MFKVVIGSLLSHWYLPTIYTDNRKGLEYHHCSAEALERIRLNQQSFNFTGGLKRLASFAGEPFEELVQDVNSWVNEIIRVRTNNLVHRGLRGDIEDARMFWPDDELGGLVRPPVFCNVRQRAGDVEVAERTGLLPPHFTWNAL